MKKMYIFISLIFAMHCAVFAQGFLRTDGKSIVNDNGEFLLRGMGLGGWMLQEGYMMQTAEFANAQYELKAKINSLIGAEKTVEFYDAWLENYVQKVDVDSMKAWGFNSIRLPMHYNLYTLPIEEEPVAGQQTWLDKGFELTDRLLQWCADNQMYLILDLHAAPGGQGYESGISDYDPSKPSLWESATNREKTVALWQKLAERYADEPWIGGYDLINETNWNMNNNKPLRDLYGAITTAIREVDQNHIIYIEGNWFANDFTGLTPPWDDNMVYSFHKYWSINDQGSIQWMLDIRNRHNIPLWCGESGENSNVWFTDAIRLFEEHNIGWAWWPYKKIEEIDGPLAIVKPAGYDRLLQYWNGNASKPTAEFAFQVLMDLAANLKLSNCVYQKDVIDAMFRQVETAESIPFTRHDIPGLIFASDYDLGTNGIAYWDEEVATYHVTTGEFTAWNNGWAYRNDGVDIQPCEDTATSNGVNVGWIGDDEWLAYTVNIDESAAYDLVLRVATESGSGAMHVQLDGRPVSRTFFIPNTGGWQNWETVTIPGVILEQGQHVLTLYFDAATFNLSFVEFDNPGPINEQDFVCLAASIENNGTTIRATMNKKIKAPLPPAPGGFSFRSGNRDISIESYALDASGHQIIFNLQEQLYFEDRVTLSYSEGSVVAIDETSLQPVSNLRVKNTLETRQAIPGRIQAEDFSVNQGFQLENTTDSGGGQNLGYSDVGDYADYLVTIKQSGAYNIEYRVASESNGGGIELLLIDDSGAQRIHRVNFPATGGWQTWTTSTHEAILPQGRYTLRIKVIKSLFNLNWMRFHFVTKVTDEATSPHAFSMAQNYPNPFNGRTTIRYTLPQSAHVALKIYNIRGRHVETLVDQTKIPGEHTAVWDAAAYPSGLYFYTLRSGGFEATRELILQK